MKSVEELYGLYPGSDIYIIGTGTSMRVFPVDFFKDKITIGLNMAWKLFSVKFAITTRPELNVPEFMEGEMANPELIWITKHQKFTSDDQRKFAQANAHRFYYFNSNGPDRTAPYPGRVVDWVRHATNDKLYVYNSMSQTATNLAANMGAKNIILVGCDNCSLLGNHHAHQQHVLWHGHVSGDERYQQYYEGLAEVRSTLRERGVNVLNMTPFLGLLNQEQDFRLLCGELQRDLLIENEDITEKIYGKKNRLSNFKNIFNKVWKL